MNEAVFFTTFFGLHAAAIIIGILVALRGLDQRLARHVTAGP